MNYLVKNNFLVSLIVAVFLVLAIPMLFSWNSTRNTITDDMQEAAKRELTLLGTLFINEANISQSSTKKLLDNFAADYMRVTYIAENGIVLYDSELSDEKLALLDNHATRQEIQAAKNFGIAASTRYSDTLGDNLVYAAETIPETAYFPAGILRIAIPASQRLFYINSILKDFFLVLGLFLAFTFAISIAQNKRLKTAIDQIMHIVENTALETKLTPALPQKPEFKELALSVADMAERVEGQLKTNLTQKVELEAILNSMQAGVVVLDAYGTIIKINPAIQKLLPQFFKAESTEALGKTTIEVFNNVDFEEYIQEALSTEQSFISHEVYFNDKSFQLNITKPANNSPIKLEIAMVLVIHDITQMTRLIEIKRDLIANASHELRTPLTAIQGYAETIQQMTATYANTLPDADRFINIIIKNAKHLDSIVTDLLALSSIENVQKIDKNEFCSINDALDLAISECQIVLDKKEVEIENQLEMSTFVTIEKDYLAQVFRNLIENACRYSSENAKIVLHGEVITKENNKKFYQICVQDYGKGIPESELSRVFERFYRVEKHRADSTISTGLGLSLCKHIIEKYDGDIHALYHAPSFLEGHQHVGATMRFTLPIHNTNG